MKLKILYIFFGITMLVLVGLIINELIPKSETSATETVSNEPTTTTQEQEIPNIKKADKIEVVNFHATQRCVSCTALGKLSEKTITEKFSGEITNGKIVFKSVNVNLPENKEIVNLYQASGSSLYINAIKDGKNNIVQNIKVWYLLSDESAFSNYLETQLRSLL